MPAPSTPGGETTSREEYPEIEERIGEDPARFLDKPLLRGESSPLQLAFARIRGIQDPEVLSTWADVERDLERGPRDRVVNAIKQRAAELNQNPPSEEPREIREDVEATYRWIVYKHDETRETEIREERPKPASVSTSSSSSTSKDVATDGGTDS